MHLLLHFQVAALSAFLVAAFSTNACDEPKWHVGGTNALAIDLRGKQMGKMTGGKKIESSSCKSALNNKRYHYAWPDAADQVLKHDTVLNAATFLSKVSGDAPGGTAYACDHMVELNMVQRVLEQTGGACDQAVTLASTGAAGLAQAQQKLMDIRAIVNNQNNLVAISKDPELLKGQLVGFLAGFTGPKFTNPFPTGADSTHLLWKVGALKFYSTGTAFPDAALAKTHAGDIDTTIRTQFTGVTLSPSTEDLWDEYVAAIDAEWLIQERAAEAKIRELACAHAAATTALPPSRPGTPIRRRASLVSGASRSTRRFLSDTGVTPFFGLDSSLTRRGARPRGSSIRSGPKAPPCATCPKKGAPQKKTVKRSQQKMKPKPATKPRQPAVRPKPRAPNQQKKVAKRPANRPVRPVGKQAPRKRITPRKKPRVVPKPPKKPKGKARPRRRR